MPVSYRLRQSGSVPGGSITFNASGNWTVPAGVWMCWSGLSLWLAYLVEHPSGLVADVVTPQS